MEPDKTYQWSYPRNSSNTEWRKGLSQDEWDKIVLSANSTDGLKISHIKIVHNGYVILDVDVNAWLDKFYQRKLIFNHEVSMQKWSLLENTRNPILHYAIMDIGKSGASKYVNSDTAWCSEFASWAIRNGTDLDIPVGSIGVNDLDVYFSSINRKYNKNDIENGVYNIRPGDYVSIKGRKHSILFVEWIDYLVTFRAISGNDGNQVKISTCGWDSVQDHDIIGAIPGK